MAEAIVNNRVHVRIFQNGAWFKYDTDFKMIESGRVLDIKQGMEKFNG